LILSGGDLRALPKLLRQDPELFSLSYLPDALSCWAGVVWKYEIEYGQLALRGAFVGDYQIGESVGGASTMYI
jgi:hypothetical protein